PAAKVLEAWSSVVFVVAWARMTPAWEQRGSASFGTIRVAIAARLNANASNANGSVVLVIISVRVAPFSEASLGSRRAETASRPCDSATTSKGALLLDMV